MYTSLLQAIQPLQEKNSFTEAPFGSHNSNITIYGHILLWIKRTLQRQRRRGKRLAVSVFRFCVLTHQWRGQYRPVDRHRPPVDACFPGKTPTPCKLGDGKSSLESTRRRRRWMDMPFRSVVARLSSEEQPIASCWSLSSRWQKFPTHRLIFSTWRPAHRTTIGQGAGVGSR